MPYKFLKYLDRKLKKVDYQICFYRFIDSYQMYNCMIQICQFMLKEARDCFIDPENRSKEEWEGVASKLRYAFPQWIDVSDEFVYKWASQLFPMNPPEIKND